MFVLGTALAPKEIVPPPCKNPVIPPCKKSFKDSSTSSDKPWFALIIFLARCFKSIRTLLALFIFSLAFWFSLAPLCSISSSSESYSVWVITPLLNLFCKSALLPSINSVSPARVISLTIFFILLNNGTIFSSCSIDLTIVSNLSFSFSMLSWNSCFISSTYLSGLSLISLILEAISFKEEDSLSVSATLEESKIDL